MFYQRIWWIFFLHLFTYVLIASPAQAQVPRVTAVRLSEPVKVDGILSEAAWKEEGISNFVQREPDEGKPASERTEVWVAYDDNALYVAARLHDRSPDSIVTRIGRRDAWISADWFYVAIDSYYDRRNAFYFGVLAGGSVNDGTHLNDGWEDDSWDGVWEVATTIDEGGWSVEMRIPYSQLRFQAKPEHRWGINFGRRIERRAEESYFVMVPRAESGWVSRFADLVGIEGINPPRRIEFTPYAVSSARFLQHAPGDPFRQRGQVRGNVGADFKVGLGANLTVNGTVNPDFGQVEVDPAVVNLSQYETFFQEKRPFFIEGSNFFDFGLGGVNNRWGFGWADPGYFYSRRVGRAPQRSIRRSGFVKIPEQTTILGAGKLTGKMGEGWSLGVMQAATAREYGRVDSAGTRTSEVVEPFTYYGVARSQREFGEGRHAVGILTTVVLRDLNEPYLVDSYRRRSYAFGLDGWTTLDADREWVLAGWTSATHVEGSQSFITNLQRAPQRYYQRPDASHLSVDPTATSLSGYGARVMLNRQKGNFRLNSAVGLLSPGFDSNDLGIIFRTDLINAHIVSGYQWYEPDGVFRRKGFNIGVARSYDFGGTRTSEIYMGLWSVQLMNFWNFGGNFGHEGRVVDARKTRGGPSMLTTRGYFAGVWGGTDSRAAISYSANAGAGRTESGGYRVHAGVGVEWKPTTRLRFSISPAATRDITIAQWVTSVEDEHATATFGRRYIFGRLEQREVSASIRADWTFTPKLSFQLYVQPLLSVGRYMEFKELRQPRTYTFNFYGENGSTISSDDGTYTVDPDGGGPAAPFTFSDPDFNFKSLRANAVVRWEFLRGSTIFAVWTHDRVNTEHPGTLAFSRDLGNLLSTEANNILLIKLTYWLNP